MSSQRGNTARSRPQKHKNRTAFKNTLHDKSNRTKLINNIQVADVCVRCKEIIEWKIKYKKYKLLSQPKKCVKCDQKTVKKAYHVMCTECGRKLGVCTKCCQSKEVEWAPPPKDDSIKLDKEMKYMVKSLSERKRRAFMRYLGKKNEEELTEENTREDQKNDLLEKLKSLKVDEDDSDGDFDSDDDDHLELSGSDEESEAGNE